MKTPLKESFFNKVTGLVCTGLVCNFVKKETFAQVFSGKFCKVFKNTFFTEYLWEIASDNILKDNQNSKYYTYLCAILYLLKVHMLLMQLRRYITVTLTFTDPERDLINHSIKTKTSKA